MAEPLRPRPLWKLNPVRPVITNPPVAHSFTVIILLTFYTYVYVCVCGEEGDMLKTEHLLTHRQRYNKKINYHFNKPKIKYSYLLCYSSSRGLFQQGAALHHSSFFSFFSFLRSIHINVIYYCLSDLDQSDDRTDSNRIHLLSVEFNHNDRIIQ